MIVDEVRIIDEWHWDRVRILVLGREYPDGPRSVMNGEGNWVAIIEGAPGPPTPDGYGISLPVRVWEAIVAKHTGTTPSTTATQTHLDDAIVVRDRLLSLFERKVG